MGPALDLWCLCGQLRIMPRLRPWKDALSALCAGRVAGARKFAHLRYWRRYRAHRAPGRIIGNGGGDEDSYWKTGALEPQDRLGRSLAERDCHTGSVPDAA